MPRSPFWLALLLAAPLMYGCSSSPDDDTTGDDDATVTGDDDTQAGDDDTQAAVDNDGDGYQPPEDCDDNNKSVHPGATETCNGIDDDCDGTTDGDNAKGQQPFYADTDQDGYGDNSSRVLACTKPAGYVEDNTDCDDSSSQAHPGGTEVCNDGLDNDCDGSAGSCGLGGDVPLTSPGASLTGASAKDQFGTTVAPAGDVNNDGYADFLIGAYQEDDKGTSSGAAYLVYGPVTGTVDLSQVVKLVGETTSDWAGLSVAGAGDVNGDGYDDVLVGAPYADPHDPAYPDDPTKQLTSAGKTYLLYGPLSGTIELSDADVIMQGVAAGDSAGYSLASAGDVNKDGFDDVLVGAWSEGTGGSVAGAAYLLYGPVPEGTMYLDKADVMFVGEDEYYLTGKSVASGDFNGDGYSDVLIGASYAGDSGQSQGAAYVVYGPVDNGHFPLSQADAKLTGEEASDHAATVVASAGDVDKDGNDDLLISAPDANNGALADTGAVYLFKGPVHGTASLATAFAKFYGELASDHAGRSVAGAGDVNGDGHADILIGKLGEANGRTNAGAAYLIYTPVAGESSLSTADARFLSVDPNDKLGFAVSSAGDVNKDGYDDVLLGVPDQSNSTDFAGVVYLELGGKGL